MYAVLQIVRGKESGQSFPLVQGKSLQIGRGEMNSVCLSDPKVSRLHCQVVYQGEKVLLTDAGSAGGTWVNGQRVREVELKPGDLIRVGDTELSFQFTHGDEVSTQEWEPPPDLQPGPFA